MIFRHPNGNHTYPKTDSLEYSLAFSHNSYSYPLTLLVLYVVRCAPETWPLSIEPVSLALPRGDLRLDLGERALLAQRALRVRLPADGQVARLLQHLTPSVAATDSFESLKLPESPRLKSSAFPLPP